MFFFGSMLGFFLICSTSDIIGRVYSIRFAWAGSVIALLSLSLSNSIIEVGISMFVLGLCLVPSSLIYYNYAV